jgi:hypothetical protein
MAADYAVSKIPKSTRPAPAAGNFNSGSDAAILAGGAMPF